jgi:hypothetical protein
VIHRSLKLLPWSMLSFIFVFYSSWTERQKKELKFSAYHINSDIMSDGLHFQLPQGSIRLLRLLPSVKGSDDVQCELFEYPLQIWDKPSHPYEALSYVWGSEDKPKSITVNKRNLNITRNLYTVLLHLRDHVCPRVMWIDAICIDQDDKKDKEHQIPLMAEIYAKAYRVVVWLGDAEGGIDRALESIRLAGENPAKLLNAEHSITQLLQQPWFQRVWVSY